MNYSTDQYFEIMVLQKGLFVNYTADNYGMVYLLTDHGSELFLFYAQDLQISHYYSDHLGPSNTKLKGQFFKYDILPHETPNGWVSYLVSGSSILDFFQSGFPKLNQKELMEILNIPELFSQEIKAPKKDFTKLFLFGAMCYVVGMVLFYILFAIL